MAACVNDADARALEALLTTRLGAMLVRGEVGQVRMVPPGANVPPPRLQVQVLRSNAETSTAQSPKAALPSSPVPRKEPAVQRLVEPRCIIQQQGQDAAPSPVPRWGSTC